MEQWNDIAGYKGLYQISSVGRVKRLEGRGCKRERLLKAQQTRNGYLQVGLYNDGKLKRVYVHRLVADTFIQNPDNLPQVNHKDENPLNNRVENLEWCTQSYNINYGTHNERAAKANTNHHKLSKPVLQFLKSGVLIAKYPSVSEAARQTGVCLMSICGVCAGKRKTAGGYVWRYRT